ncbi:uncharacterized protein DS421_20g695510 [Arachis hypogaea]|nr:uncharacterized protein DS421_20g695510 [Arachis hypogaea]
MHEMEMRGDECELVSGELVTGEWRSHVVSGDWVATVNNDGEKAKVRIVCQRIGEGLAKVRVPPIEGYGYAFWATATLSGVIPIRPLPILKGYAFLYQGLRFGVWE